jgi:hypothetical protein
MTKSQVVWVLYLGLTLELIILLVSGYQTDNLTTFFQSCARYSGRVSLLLFSIAFISYPINRLSAEDESGQRKLVLYFAIVHLIHFGFLATYLYLSQSALIPVRLAGGALAYLLIIIYPIIQSVKPSARFWSNLFPPIYYYYVWLIFFLSYLPRVRQQLPDVSGNLETYYVLFAYVIILLFIQLFLMQKRFKQQK